MASPQSWDAHFLVVLCSPWFYELKLKTSLSLKSWHFEASEDIMTKFQLQVLHIIIIKY